MTVDAPIFSVMPGTYNTPQTITITGPDDCAIYYTLDGSEPTTSATLYTQAIEISQTTTVKAIAVLDGTSSDVATATYTIEATSAPTQEAVIWTDILSPDMLALGNNVYTDFAQIQHNSQALYAGSAAHATSISAIQLRSTNASGIVSTRAGGKIKRIEITWANSTVNGNKLMIYCKNTAYASSQDLYNQSKRGTLVATLEKGNELTQTFEPTSDYTYIGMCSNSGTLYISQIAITWVLTEAITVGSTGYATMYYSNGNWALPPEVSAYGLTYNNGALQAVRVAGGIVPAGQAVLLQAEPGLYVIEGSYEAGCTIADNCLRGTENDCTVSAEDGNSLYILGNGKQGLGFYLASADGQSFTCGAHKAYLEIPQPYTSSPQSTQRAFLALPRPVTGINSATARQNDTESIYSISGMKMTHPLRPGIYITGGKKVIIP